MYNSQILLFLTSKLVGAERKVTEHTKLAKELNMYEEAEYIYKLDLPFIDFNKDTYRILKIDLYECNDLQERVVATKVDNTWNIKMYYLDYVRTQRAIKQFAKFLLDEYKEEKDNKHKRNLFSLVFDGVHEETDEDFYKMHMIEPLEEIPF